MHDQITPLPSHNSLSHTKTLAHTKTLCRSKDMAHPKGCTTVDPDLIDRLQTMVIYRTDAALTEQFGISYNTWRKLIGGQPVRASLLTRLEARVAMLEAQGAARKA